MSFAESNASYGIGDGQAASKSSDACSLPCVYHPETRMASLDCVVHLSKGGSG